MERLEKEVLGKYVIWQRLSQKPYQGVNVSERYAISCSGCGTCSSCGTCGARIDNTLCTTCSIDGCGGCSGCKG